MEPPIPSEFKGTYGPNIFNGLPYIGDIYDRKESDPDYKQPVLVQKVHIKQFDLSDEKDMSEWNGICQRVADGVSVISFEEKIYDKELKSWRVLLRWMDEAYTKPEGVTDD